jgi:protein TonB
VGLTGLLMPAVPHAAPAKKLPPVQATLIHVELTRTAAPTPNSAAETSPPAALEPPAPPPLAAVAPPTATVAFALPTSGPTRTVSAAQAVPTPSADQNAAPTVERLTYGEGEGQQPAPEYPLEADLAGQRGSVLVRFTVGEDGRVTSAEVIQPCPYPLLNQSAVRTIREEWRFKPGPVRVDEIIIQFRRKHE